MLLVLLAIHVLLLACETAKSCNTAYGCANIANVDTTVACNAGFSCYGSSSIIGTSGWIDCVGIYSCMNVAEIIPYNGSWMSCEAAYSCRNSSIQVSFNMACGGTGSCINSNIHENRYYGSNVYYGTGLDCDGSISCAMSNISGQSSVRGRANYSLYGTSIYSSGTDMTVDFQGNYAGYNASIYCNDGDTCTIRCYDNGCYNTYIFCSDSATCSVSCTSSNYDCPFSLTMDDAKILELTYDLIASSDIEWDSVVNDANTVDCLGASSSSSCYGTSLTYSDGSLSCGGSQSCTVASGGNVPSYVISDDRNNNNASIFCNGEKACSYIYNTKGVYLTSEYDIYCGSYEACRETVVTSGNAVYCNGDRSCYGAFINNVKDVYCDGVNSCTSTVFRGIKNYYGGGYRGYFSNSIYSNGSDINVILAGYQASYGLKIYCEAGDSCYIECGSYSACTSMTLYCYGDCSYYCSSTRGLNVICPTINILDSGTATQVTEPTSAPVAQPSIDPSKMPSMMPSAVPSIMPTMNPTVIVTDTPSSIPFAIPTMTPSLETISTQVGYASSTTSMAPETSLSDYCNETEQTEDTFLICYFLVSLDSLPSFVNNFNQLNEVNYCDSLTDYFECYQDSDKMKKILWSNSGISGDINELLNNMPQNITVLDLSNNEFDNNETISWNLFENMAQLSELNLANNEFSGTINLEYLQGLKHLNLENNQFSGIELETLEELIYLETFYISDNKIVANMDLSLLPGENLTVFHCYNNSFYGNLDMNDIAQTLVDFNCGNNNFDSLIWEVVSSSDQYNLEKLDLSNGNLDGEMDMSVLDVVNGVFGNLVYFDLSNNNNLNISIDFVALNGSSMEYFNLLNVVTSGDADFSYLSDFIVVKLGKSVKCMDNYCLELYGSNSVSTTRSNETCMGQDECFDTCECVTLSLSITESDTSYLMDSDIWLLFIAVLIIMAGACSLCLLIGLLDSKRRNDDFSLFSGLAYLLQIMIFYCDIFLCYHIGDRWYQEQDSGTKNKYLLFFVFCGIFILIPWLANLRFLFKSKKEWTMEEMDSRQDVATDGSRNDVKSALLLSKIETGKWLNNSLNFIFLIMLCALSGGFVASLKLVNSKLFGMNVFDMGLTKFKQDEAARHRLWLNVLLQDIEQIIICVLVGTMLLGEYDDIVLLALILSGVSVLLSLLNLYFNYPKRYYIYEMKCKLKNNNNNNKNDKKEESELKLESKLRQRKALSLSICDGLGHDYEYLFVENVFIIDAHYIVMNVMCQGKIDLHSMNSNNNMNGKMQLIEMMKSRCDIICDDIDLKFVKYYCVESILTHATKMNKENENGFDGIGMTNINSNTFGGDTDTSNKLGYSLQNDLSPVPATSIRSISGSVTPGGDTDHDHDFFDQLEDGTGHEVTGHGSNNVNNNVSNDKGMTSDSRGDRNVFMEGNGTGSGSGGGDDDSVSDTEALFADAKAENRTKDGNSGKRYSNNKNEESMQQMEGNQGVTKNIINVIHDSDSSEDNDNGDNVMTVAGPTTVGSGEVNDEGHI